MNFLNLDLEIIKKWSFAQLVLFPNFGVAGIVPEPMKELGRPAPLLLQRFRLKCFLCKLTSFSISNLSFDLVLMKYHWTDHWPLNCGTDSVRRLSEPAVEPLSSPHSKKPIPFRPKFENTSSVIVSSSIFDSISIIFVSTIINIVSRSFSFAWR